MDAVIDGIGSDRTALRISPQNTFNDSDDSDPQALFSYVAASLSGKGLAYLHIVEGMERSRHSSVGITLRTMVMI